MSLYTIVTCPNCKMRILPKADGTCPSCQAIIPQKKGLISKSVEPIENSEASANLKQESSSLTEIKTTTKIVDKRRASHGSVPTKLKDETTMKADNTERAKKEHMQTKKRSPIYFGASGCALGFIIMVCFVAAVALVGPLLYISGKTYATILNVGSWVLPIGLGVLGYFYGKSKQ